MTSFVKGEKSILIPTETHLANSETHSIPYVFEKNRKLSCVPLCLRGVFFNPEKSLLELSFWPDSLLPKLLSCGLILKGGDFSGDSKFSVTVSDSEERLIHLLREHGPQYQFILTFEFRIKEWEIERSLWELYT